jgi:hypothetical protein
MEMKRENENRPLKANFPPFSGGLRPKCGMFVEEEIMS